LLGYTKICYFLCEWDSKDKEHHYIQKHGPKQKALILAQKNVINNPLINPEKS